MNGEHKPGDDTAGASAAAGNGNERLVRLPDALQAVSLGRTAWLDLVKSGTAPQPVKIGRATFWVWSELQAFIAERIRQSRKA
jgi:prophage regulatory protein